MIPSYAFSDSGFNEVETYLGCAPSCTARRKYRLEDGLTTLKLHGNDIRCLAKVSGGCGVHAGTDHGVASLTKPRTPDVTPRTRWEFDDLGRCPPHAPSLRSRPALPPPPPPHHTTHVLTQPPAVRGRARSLCVCPSLRAPRPPSLRARASLDRSTWPHRHDRDLEECPLRPGRHREKKGRRLRRHWLASTRRFRVPACTRPACCTKCHAHTHPHCHVPRPVPRTPHSTHDDGEGGGAWRSRTTRTTWHSFTIANRTAPQLTRMLPGLPHHCRTLSKNNLQCNMADRGKTCDPKVGEFRTPKGNFSFFDVFCWAHKDWEMRHLCVCQAKPYVHPYTYPNGMFCCLDDGELADAKSTGAQHVMPACTCMVSCGLASASTAAVLQLQLRPLIGPRLFRIRVHGCRLPAPHNEQRLEHTCTRRHRADRQGLDAARRWTRARSTLAEERHSGNAAGKGTRKHPA